MLLIDFVHGSTVVDCSCLRGVELLVHLRFHRSGACEHGAVLVYDLLGLVALEVRVGLELPQPVVAAVVCRGGAEGEREEADPHFLSRSDQAFASSCPCRPGKPYYFFAGNLYLAASRVDRPMMWKLLLVSLAAARALPSSMAKAGPLEPSLRALDDLEEDAQSVGDLEATRGLEEGMPQHRRKLHGKYGRPQAARLPAVNRALRELQKDADEVGGVVRKVGPAPCPPRRRLPVAVPPACPPAFARRHLPSWLPPPAPIVLGSFRRGPAAHFPA